MAYIIKITHKTSNNNIRHGYYSLNGGFTYAKVIARRFHTEKVATRYVLSYKNLCPCDETYIINEENDIGTYFSTCDKKPKIKGILVNILCIILLPILLPIVGIIMIKEYTMKLIGKEYR